MRSAKRSYVNALLRELQRERIRSMIESGSAEQAFRLARRAREVLRGSDEYLESVINEALKESIRAEIASEERYLLNAYALLEDVERIGATGRGMEYGPQVSAWIR